MHDAPEVTSAGSNGAIVFDDDISTTNTARRAPATMLSAAGTKRPSSLITDDHSDSAMPPLTKKTKTLRPVALRADVKISSPPTLSDFQEPKVRALLLLAIREYEILICTKNAFPSLAVRTQWAEQCWTNAQREGDKPDDKNGTDDDIGFYAFTNRVLRLVCFSFHNTGFTSLTYTRLRDVALEFAVKLLKKSDLRLKVFSAFVKVVRLLTSDTI